MFLSVFSLTAPIGFQLYCHWLSVYSFISWSTFLSMLSLSKYPRILPLISRVYVRHITRVSLSLFLNVYASVRIYYHSVFVFIFVFWSVFLSLFFLWLFLCVFGYFVTDCMYIGISRIPRFCLSLYACDSLSVRVYYRWFACMWTIPFSSLSV